MIGTKKAMFFLIDEHGEYLGKFPTVEAAMAALDELVQGEIAAQDEVAVVELDRNGRRVGEPIRHGESVPA